MKKRPRTFATTVRLDIRSVATILKWMVKNSGIPPRSITEALSNSVEIVAHMARRADISVDFKSSAEAEDYLNHSGYRQPRVSKTNSRNLKKQIEREFELRGGLQSMMDVPKEISLNKALEEFRKINKKSS